MSVRAIFYVEHVTVERKHTDDDGNLIRTGEVELRPSLRGPYKEWAKYTPYGELKLGTLNPAALAWFEERLGQDVALTFDDRPKQTSSTSSCYRPGCSIVTDERSGVAGRPPSG